MGRSILAAPMARRLLVAITLLLLCVLIGHDTLMAAQVALPNAHHVAAVSGSAHTAPVSHDAPAPHPEMCDTALRAVPQPTVAPPTAALPCVLPMRTEAAVFRGRPVQVDVLPIPPPTVRRAMLQVYRL